MGNMDQTTQMLLLLLAGAIVILFVLIIVYFIVRAKDKKSNSQQKEKARQDIPQNSSKDAIESDKQSILNFMEFDKIEDNMIIQKNGKKFVMVIECQGVNYDLMSGVEKTGVEEGFVRFLNTLRSPIQIYIQTRTVNLESSLNTYKSKITEIESKLIRMQQQYRMALEDEYTSKQQTEQLFYEMTRLRNLYEYGKDVVSNTERMSLNKNILNKKYYVVISYYPDSELDKANMDEREIQAEAFSELYTRAQSLIRSLSICSVTGKILNTVELSELLYVAYNRDDSEIMNLRRAVQLGYDAEYSTAQEVLDKKMKELDKLIENKAIEIAQESVEKVRSKKRQAVEEKEESIEELADEMAALILNQNKEYLGEDIVEQAIQEIKGELKDEIGKDEGGNSSEKKKKTTRTRTTKKTTK